MAAKHVVGEAPKVYPNLEAARQAKVEADARLTEGAAHDEPTDVPASDQG